MSGSTIAILIAFVCYLLLMIGIGVVSMKKTNNTEDYFLGGRGLNGWVAALSAQASDMSGWLLMGLPGSIYVAGTGKAWIGIGLYWSASALFQYIQQVAFNYHYDHADMDKIIEKSREKAAKKKKKKGPSLYEKMLGMQAEQQGQQGADSNIKKSANLKSTQNIEYSGNSKGGIASKANALNKNKGGK